MRFLGNQQPPYELTYNDVFLVPSKSNIKSRFDVNMTPDDGVGTTIPVIVANMNAVAGKRMAETVARRGGLVVLPQDMPESEIESTIKYVKSRDLLYETPLLLEPQSTIAAAMSIIHKRSHGAVIIVDNKHKPVGIFKEKDAEGHDRFTQMSEVMITELVTVQAGLPPKRIFELLQKKRVTVAPVIRNGKVIGLTSQKSALRSTIYTPAVDKNNHLLVAVAVGINGDIADKLKRIKKLGADIIVLDTAHGHQQKMLSAIKTAKSIAKNVPIVAGTVVTAQATRELIEAGADIIKVGIGAGAMCTTRVMTAVGRPQFSAVHECAKAARELGKHVWADAGIRYPRDLALALAAGASSAMWGSMWAGTYESVGDVLTDTKGRLYKENFGMASRRAVRNRNRDSSLFEQTKKEFFEEGISTSKAYLNEERPGAEDIIDWVIAGLRSSMSYMGAKNLEEFYDQAIVGVQSAAGYQEGEALKTNWV